MTSNRPSGFYRVDSRVTVTVFHSRNGWWSASVYKGRNLVVRSARWLRRPAAVRQAVRMYRAECRARRLGEVRCG